MHPCCLIASKKAACKGPNHLVLNACSFLMVHECDFRLETKMDFGICDHKVGFLKYSHILYEILFDTLYVISLYL